ncbi:hypothetical protein COPCOM_03789 [Coprococcus comes ATCC 27758]|uniref:Uncharacterized protein n=1 Tax=Coprococcus comes ATCC 27758 TaxID=470146 RepID=C0BF27_9FIRM|nr:hypothetical protein COPCOM_03789 [Coprococcus comes ATCC 27758]
MICSHFYASIPFCIYFSASTPANCVFNRIPVKQKAGEML